MPRLKLSYLLAVFLVLFLVLTPALSGQFCASTKSSKYHYPSCRWAKKIKPGNKIVFASAQKARQAGYQPCKVCSPPAE